MTTINVTYHQRDGVMAGGVISAAKKMASSYQQSVSIIALAKYLK